jgi:putative Holliday junction resolvase
MDNFLALDVGTQRIGVAVASGQARLVRPLTTLIHTNQVFEQLTELITQEHAGVVVVGLPRGLSGQETDQTTYSRDFAAQLATHISAQIVLQDEAVTSRQAEAELQARGKPYTKPDIDALAAVYILEDYLAEVPREESNHE